MNAPPSFDWLLYSGSHFHLSYELKTMPTATNRPKSRVAYCCNRLYTCTSSRVVTTLTCIQCVTPGNTHDDVTLSQSEVSLGEHD